jgi:hypothetical protein
MFQGERVQNTLIDRVCISENSKLRRMRASTITRNGLWADESAQQRMRTL